MGLGTQDDLGSARDFLADVGVTHRLVWDASGRSWQQLGIQIQPASVLVRADGTVIKRWNSGIPFDQILAALPR